MQILATNFFAGGAEVNGRIMFFQSRNGKSIFYMVLNDVQIRRYRALKIRHKYIPVALTTAVSAVDSLANSIAASY